MLSSQMGEVPGFQDREPQGRDRPPIDTLWPHDDLPPPGRDGHICKELSWPSNRLKLWISVNTHEPGGAGRARCPSVDTGRLLSETRGGGADVVERLRVLRREAHSRSEVALGRLPCLPGPPRSTPRAGPSHLLLCQCSPVRQWAALGPSLPCHGLISQFPHLCCWDGVLRRSCSLFPGRAAATQVLTYAQRVLSVTHSRSEGRSCCPWGRRCQPLSPRDLGASGPRPPAWGPGAPS